MRHLCIATLAAALAALQSTNAAGPGDWPRFRGPDGGGVADGSTLPQNWSTTTNVAWSIDVPGRGWSSPIVWRDRVFLTSAVNPGTFKAPSTGIYGNDYAAELQKQGLPDDEILKKVVNRDIELTDRIRRHQLRRDGGRREERQGRCGSRRRIKASRSAGGTARTRTRRKRRSPTASACTPRSAATSACSVIRWTASCCGSRSWAPQPIYLDFGTASSPVVHGGRVYQLHDNDGQSFLAALDAKTGEELWTVKRIDSCIASYVGVGDAVRMGSRRAHRDRHDRAGLRDQLRH